MSVVLDASFVVAHYDRADSASARARAWHDRNDEELVTTPVVLAEMDHLVRRRGGEVAQRALWHDLDAGAVGVRWWADAIAESLVIAREHPFLGLADASLVALAGRLRTNRIATLDTHFRSITMPNGEGFILLPDDARPEST